MTGDFLMQQKRRTHNQSCKYRLRCRTQDATRWKSVKSHSKIMAISNRSSFSWDDPVNYHKKFFRVILFRFLLKALFFILRPSLGGMPSSRTGHFASLKSCEGGMTGWPMLVISHWRRNSKSSLRINRSWSLSWTPYAIPLPSNQKTNSNCQLNLSHAILTC